MRRLLVWLCILLLCAPVWARLGGGGGYRSSSRSSSSSSYSRSTSSSSSSSYSSRSSSRSSAWGGSSSSYSGSGSYSRGSYNGGGSILGGLWNLFVLVLMGVLVMAVMANFFRTRSGKHKPMMGCSCVAVLSGFFLFFANPFGLGMLALFYLFVVKRASDGGIGDGLQQSMQGITGMLNAAGADITIQGDAPSSPAFLPVEPFRELVRDDVNFSLPLFREFAVLLYCQAMQERPGGQFLHSRPYLSPRAQESLQRRSQAQAVSDVVVGTCQVRKAQLGHARSMVNLELESNYIEQTPQGQQAFVAREIWTLERKLGVLTPPPKPVSSLACPSCGYSGDIRSDGVCPQCGMTNLKGDFSWVVTGIAVQSLEPFRPHAAEGGGMEAGTTLATRTQRDLARRREDFLARHPDFSWEEFWARASGIFLKLQQAWTERDPSACRPYETDVLFRQHRYWIEENQRQGRINKLSDVKVERWELSSLEVDAYYESITARVFASMIDVTTDESGKILYGDPNRPRRFSEYWTFLRRVGCRKPKGDSLHQCPSCGAPLDKINQTGECEYCQTVVTLGDFDWVLTNIEQDEVYGVNL